MNSVIAFRPAVTLDTEGFNDVLLGKEIINVAEVVAEGSIAGELDVIYVEFGGISGDLGETFLAFNQSDFPRSVEDKVLASSEDQLEGIVVNLADDAVFESVDGVLGILPVSRDKTITDSSTLEVEVGVSLLEEVSRDGGNVVSSVGFTGNIERSSVELRISFQEFSQEEVHIFSNFSFVANVGSSVGEASTEGLINVEKIGLVVPGVGVGGKSQSVLIDLEGSVFDEKGQFRRASGSTSQPEDERIIRGFRSGFKPPIEQVTLVFNWEESGVISFVQKDGVGITILRLDEFSRSGES